MKGSPVCGVLVMALGAVCLEPVLFAQQQQPEPPPIVIGGTPGTGGGGGTGGPAGGAGGGATGAAGGAAAGSSGGYDGYGDIDWDGPDDVPFSPLAFQPVAVDGLTSLFKMTTRGLASSVRPQPRQFADAIEIVEIEIERRASDGTNASVVRGLEAEAATPEGVAHLGTVAAAAALARHLDYALAAVLAQVKAAPDDPTNLYSMASLLVQRKMPNEALAVLDRIKKSGKLPTAPFGYQPAASVDYLRGYALMMIGQVQESASLLKAAFAADPTLTDASYTLAVAQSALGQNPRKALLQGLLRAYHGPLMYCGDKYTLDPLETEEDQNVAPPADKIFDMSKGQDGVLPLLTHPASGPQLVAMVQELATRHQALEDEVLKHSKKADDLYLGLSARLDRSGPDAQDLTDQALVDMLDEANACLKPLQRMLEDKNQLLEGLGDRIQQTTNAMEADFRSLIEASDPDAANAIWRRMIDKGLATRRGPIRDWDAAVRRHFKAWHKYATGLAGHITSPEWREYADEKIRAAEAAEWASLYANVIGNYAAGLAASPELYAPATPPPAPTTVSGQEPWLCTPAHQKASLEVKLTSILEDRSTPLVPGAPDVGLNFKANCDKMALEADAKFSAGMGPFKAGVGGFTEASVNRAGDITLFGGPKLSADASVGSASLSSSVKYGVYITFDADGIKEAGGKIAFSDAASSGPLKTSLKGDDMAFPIWTAPPRPPKFDKETGLTIWKNVH
jgi:hypothetical protein